MYGLPQAGKLANIQLQHFLAPHGYHPCPFTPGLWTHITQDIWFTLVVNDFVVHYTNCTDIDHFLKALKLHYQVTEDWDASCYCGLMLTWDYKQHIVDLAMPGYINHALKQFRHPQPKQPKHAPHAWQQPTYGTTTHFAPEPNHTPALDAAN